jgi:hypothetical protein
MGVRLLKKLLGAVTAQGKKTHRQFRPTVLSATQPKQRHWFVDAIGFIMYLAERRSGASYWDFGALQALVRDVLATLARAGLVVHLFFDAPTKAEPAPAAPLRLPHAALEAFQALGDDGPSGSSNSGSRNSSGLSNSKGYSSSPAQTRPVKKAERAHWQVSEVRPLGLRRAMLDAILESVAAHPGQVTVMVTRDEAERVLIRELQRSKLSKDEALIISNDSDVFMCKDRSLVWREVVVVWPAHSLSLTVIVRSASPRKHRGARGGMAPSRRERACRGLRQRRGEVPVRQLRILGRPVPRPRSRAPAGPRARAGLQRGNGGPGAAWRVLRSPRPTGRPPQTLQATQGPARREHMLA